MVTCGDCLDPAGGMPALESRTVHAVVTDPPYCSGGATEAGRANAPGQGLRSETLRGGRFSWFAADNRTTQGIVWLLGECAVQWAGLDLFAFEHTLHRQRQGDKTAGDSGRPGAAIGLQHVAVERDGVFAQGF